MDEHPNSPGAPSQTVESLPRLSPDLACPQCGVLDTPTVGPGSGPHAAAALCRHCGRWLSWLSRYTPEERQARRQQAQLQAMAQKPPSQLQLAYLQALSDAGPPPANMAQASERIDALVRREVQP